jgi:Tol biopolymer transport system component
MSFSPLVIGDTNGMWDVFVRDRRMATTELVSIATSGMPSNGFSGLFGLRISPDGRFVAFESAASSLVTGDTNGARDIFLRDRLMGTTERVSLGWNGVQGNGNCFHLSLSADGRYVAFESLASNLVPGDTNAHNDIFLRDRVNGTTELVSVSVLGSPSNGDSQDPSISGDGRYVGFTSVASDLVVGDTNGHADVFVRDRLNGATSRISLGWQSGAQGDGNSGWPSITADGRYVAFTSEATNLVLGDTNGNRDCFIRDLRTSTTELVSISIGGTTGNGTSSAASISSDGRFVGFESNATDLVPSVSSPEVYIRDRQNQRTEVVSVATDGSLPNAYSSMCSLSADGRYAAFRSGATNLVPGDTNGQTDVFIHDRFATGFTSLCDPGVNNVIACPCGNAPATTNRGCDNSFSTGGATLSASGCSYLSIDSLSFSTSLEAPSATSILLEGTASVPNGLVFGQGVRCAGGALARMYVKTAVNGSITAPEAGDPTVSSRSAQLGLPIRPGVPLFYLVYYRDPTVLGGCSAMSTFNATQTGSVSWWP